LTLGVSFERYCVLAHSHIRNGRENVTILRIMIAEIIAIMQFILVADWCSNKVALLSPNSEFVRYAGSDVSQPTRLYFDQSSCSSPVCIAVAEQFRSSCDSVVEMSTIPEKGTYLRIVRTYHESHQLHIFTYLLHEFTYRNDFVVRLYNATFTAAVSSLQCCKHYVAVNECSARTCCVIRSFLSRARVQRSARYC